MMPMCNLIEYDDNYSGTTRGLQQYHKNEPKYPITDSNSFKFNSRYLAKTIKRGILKTFW